MYACVYIYIEMNWHLLCVFMYVAINVHKFIHLGMYIGKNVLVCVSMHICLYECLNFCIYVCMQAGRHVNMYIHTHYIYE